MKLRIIPVTGILLVLLVSCTRPIEIIPKSNAQIYITGSTLNNVSVTWKVHGHTGAQNLTLNHGISNPWVVSYDDLNTGAFGEIYMTVQNSLGNQVILTGDTSIVDLWLGSEKTLDLENLGVPADLTGIQIGNLLEDNSGQLLYVVDVLTGSVPHQLVVKDSDNQFDPGAWRILSSNSAYFSVWIVRDGLVLGTPKTYSTLIGDVTFSYGSSVW